MINFYLSCGGGHGPLPSPLLRSATVLIKEEEEEEEEEYLYWLTDSQRIHSVSSLQKLKK